MLVLSRRAGESIRLEIGDKVIVVSVVRIQGTGAKLTIEAPESVKIVRSELLAREAAA